MKNTFFSISPYHENTIKWYYCKSIPSQSNYETFISDTYLIKDSDNTTGEFDLTFNKVSRVNPFSLPSLLNNVSNFLIQI